MDIAPATHDDGAAIRGLLAACGLPVDDLGQASCAHFLVWREAGELLGTVGIDIVGDVGLLRSLAVDPRRRAEGAGAALITAAETLARRHRLSALYLLTNSAEPLFAARGYCRLPRDAAPAAIAAQPQFSAICPSSATFMSKTMPHAPYNVLFLCTGNSARSILAEAAINSLPVSRERFRGYSAGSQPKGEVNPNSLVLLREIGIATDTLRSKSWDEFAQAGAPAMDFVFTVCDQAAGEACPLWPGHPVTAHWGMPDPAAVVGSDEVRRRAFSETWRELCRRIELFASLPLESLDRMTLQQRVREIVRS
ncbi:arsenic resistance N-acetyltransferase ArsN2 [Solimonas variicoloris]|uniref:arsenic resistance N-acetyltransferase ArsN2 n=1 Tax=Solimonas variicoloris TaxID=254408 RepID=UPI00036DF5BA